MTVLPPDLRRSAACLDRIVVQLTKLCDELETLLRTSHQLAPAKAQVRARFGRPWTRAELEQLRERYPHEDTAALAKRLGRTRASVTQQALAHGLRKSPGHLASLRAARITKLVASGEAHRFGATNWTPTDRMRATQFKPGNRPGNWLPVGALRINSDGYLDRKITDTGYPLRDWKGVHRLVWEAAHGSIPPGHVVTFRPGRRTTDPTLITPDALELVTHAELMRRNSVHRLPPELVSLVQLRGRLVRQINKHTKSPTP